MIFSWFTNSWINIWFTVSARRSMPKKFLIRYLVSCSQMVMNLNLILCNYYIFINLSIYFHPLEIRLWCDSLHTHRIINLYNLYVHIWLKPHGVLVILSLHFIVIITFYIIQSYIYIMSTLFWAWPHVISEPSLREIIMITYTAWIPLSEHQLP